LFPMYNQVNRIQGMPVSTQKGRIQNVKDFDNFHNSYFKQVSHNSASQH
jgi:hypothetical protein